MYQTTIDEFCRNRDQTLLLHRLRETITVFSYPLSFIHCRIRSLNEHIFIDLLVSSGCSGSNAYATANCDITPFQIEGTRQLTQYLISETLNVIPT